MACLSSLQILQVSIWTLKMAGSCEVPVPVAAQVIGGNRRSLILTLVYNSTPGLLSIHPYSNSQAHFNRTPASSTLIYTMAIFKTATLIALLAALANAGHSADPGVGSNPKAEGATDKVTSKTGPNGYGLFEWLYYCAIHSAC
jgi:hypothetical protein